MIPLSAIQSALSGVRLGDLANSFIDVDFADLRAAVDAAVDPSGAAGTLALLTDLDDLTLGDLPATLDALDTLLLGQLGAALADVTFADLVLAIDDPGAEAELESILDGLTDPGGEPLLLGDLGSLGDVTLGDLIEGDADLSLADIAPLLGFITVENLAELFQATITVPGTPLADIDPPELLGQLTLADLVGQGELDAVIVTELLEQLGLEGLLAGFTLTDLLLALVDPASLPFGGVDFEDVDVRDLPAGTIAPVSLDAEFQLIANDTRTIRVEVLIPDTAAFVPGSGRVVATDDGGTITTEQDADQDGSTLTWSILADPDTQYEVSFDLLPSLQLGSSPVTATARIVGTDVTAPDAVDITVLEGIEPNDFELVGGARQTTPAAEDVVYLTYVSSETDQDVFQIDVNENDRLVVELGNLDADLDLVLYGRPSDTAVGALLANDGDQPPLIPVTDPDADATSSEPLDDFVRLDGIDPTLELIEVANGAGTVNEVLSSGRLPAGTYFLQVAGANGATTVSPATLQVKKVEADVRPDCALPPALPAALPGSVPADFETTDANTLILLNEQRLEQWYPGTGRADVLTAIDDLVDYLTNDPVGSQLGIDPIVVPVDGFGPVQTAYDAWDADQCDPEAANAVVAAINEFAIDPLREQLDHVVILGADEIIPMARLVDATTIANEYDYRNEFDGDALSGGDVINSATSYFWDSRYLSDEPYGESAARSLGDRFLYVSDVALGRVVETPADIVGALQTFETFDGTLDVTTGEVLGYDFLADGSEEIADTLVAELGAANVERDAADGFVPDPAGGQVAWDRAYAEGRLAAAATNALISLNAHFDHYRALPALGDKQPDFEDLLVAQDVRDLLDADALAQSLIFSMGCHSGLSVSDVLVGPASNQDWAQETGELGALYVGNTGFGYGDTEVVAYTEKLMSLFAQRVTGPLDLPSDGGLAPSTVGQALTYAKNDFVASLQTFSVYDEKALQESTFYGLPFYRVGLDAAPLPAPPDNAAVEDATGTPSVTFTAVGANEESGGGDRGTFFSNPDGDGDPQTIVAPGRPVQPVTTIDVSVVDPANTTQLDPDFRARGALVTEITSEWREVADPVIATPIFDESTERGEPEFVGAFPAKPVTLNTATGPGGERQRLAVATGQFQSGTPGVQRLDEEIEVVVYYADENTNDVLPPTIGVVDAEFSDGVLSVDVDVTDPSGVDRAYVLVAPDPVPGRTDVDWIPLELRNASGDRWTGTLALGQSVEEVDLIVQAKDEIGNVAYATNKAQNFSDEVVPDSPAPDPPATQLAVEVATTGLQAGWYPAGSVDATVVSAATPASVSVDGGPFVTVGVGEPFPITGTGTVPFVVRTEAGREIRRSVRIDDGPPIADVTVAGGEIDAICRDVSPVTCEVLLDGVSVPNGTPIPDAPGIYEVEVVATDVLGNEARATITVEVGPPVISVVTGPTEPQPIAVPVRVDATFDDPSLTFDAYTATIDWGDGTVTTSTDGDVDVVAPDTDVSGAIGGAHTYTAPGVYVVTVEVNDGVESDTAVYEFVVVYEPDETGRVSGSGFYRSGREAYSDGPRFGSLASFGYRARYVRDEVEPRGETRLRLFGEFFFRSTRYDYLTVNDTMAVAEGIGVVNGGGDYRFRVQGIDNGRIDFFQITIWDDVTGEVLYDNGILFDVGDLVLLGGIRVRE